jgi:hypothetical protein
LRTATHLGALFDVADDLGESYPVTDELLELGAREARLDERRELLGGGALVGASSAHLHGRLVDALEGHAVVDQRVDHVVLVSLSYQASATYPRKANSRGAVVSNFQLYRHYIETPNLRLRSLGTIQPSNRSVGF